MTAENLQFPEFGRYPVTHRLPAVTLLALIAALTWPRWRWAGGIALILLLILALPMLVIDIANAWRRFAWVRGFEGRMHPRNLAAHVRQQPGRHRLHVRCYQGFGVNAVRPAAVLEDTQSGSLHVITPSSDQIDLIAMDLGVEVRHH